MKVETWRRGEPIPDWITDNCKIVGMEGDRLIPWYREVSAGGYEIVKTDGSSLISTKSITDYVCLGDGKIFSLTETQIGLLYKPLEK